MRKPNTIKSQKWYFSLNALFLFTIIFFSGCKKAFEEINVSSSENSARSQVSAHPNIILILADDVGYEIPHYSGGQAYQTPAIDFLAANGMQFTQCRATPLCSPSRVELLTGMYNFRNYEHWGMMPEGAILFPKLLQNAGYKTCLAGKWQFWGEDSSVRQSGFDKYIINGVRKDTGYQTLDAKNWFKNPTMLMDGRLVTEPETTGKYGEDLVRDYMLNFINNNKKNPFFVYWSPRLCHEPFSPTPDNPDFESWDPESMASTHDTVYFSSMVKYMDKLVGQLLEKLKNSSLENNTIIIFTGDNGTDGSIYSRYKGMTVQGKKGQPLEAGTHVPLAVYYPGHIQAGSVNRDLVDICDFWPTILDLAGVTYTRPENLDGVSFAPRLPNNAATERDWSFCHFYAHPEDMNSKPPQRYVTDGQYKRYDSTTNFGKKGFFDIRKDLNEENPIKYSLMTPAQQKINTAFLEVLSEMH